MTQRRVISFPCVQQENAAYAMLRYLDRPGWSAQGMLNLFGKPGQQEALTIDRLDPYPVTHPLTQDRTALPQHHVETMLGDDRHLATGFEARFQMVTARLSGFLYSVGRVAQHDRPTDRSPPARNANAAVAQRAGRAVRAVQIVDRLMGEQPANGFIAELKGQILVESGQAQAAIAPCPAAVRRAPDQPLIHRVSAAS
jgi:predicted Zn-dependent protease